MYELAERLESALKHARMEAKDLASAIGIHKQTITAIKKGKLPGTKHLPDMARVLGCPLQWLASGAGQAPPWARSSKPTPPILSRLSPDPLPIVGTVSAGDGFVDSQADGRFTLGASWCVVHVKGMSAYPVVYPDQWVLIDSERTATVETWDETIRTDLDDNLCLIHLVDGRALLKRFCKADRAPGGFVLASVNSGLETPYVPPEDVVSFTPVVGVLYEDPSQPRRKKYRMRREVPVEVVE